MSSLLAFVWGMLAAQFCVQIGLFVNLFAFALIGYVTEAKAVPRSNNVAAMVSTMSGGVVFTLLLIASYWLAEYWQIEMSVAFWIGAGLSAIYCLVQVPVKLRNGWRDTMLEDAWLRKAYEAARDYKPPQRPPAATYAVHFSDGMTQQTALTAEEIDRWAKESNSDAEARNLPFRIVRIEDAAGNVVWGNG